MQTSPIDSPKLLHNFFIAKDIHSFKQMCTELDGMQADEPKVVWQYLSKADAKVALRVQKMVAFIKLSGMIKDTCTFRETVKMCIAGAVLITSEQKKGVFPFKKKDSGLAYSLLIDCSRRAVAFLFKIQSTDREYQTVFGGIECQNSDIDTEMLCRKITYKRPTPDRPTVSHREAQFTKLYGCGLSVLASGPEKWQKQALITMEAFDSHLRPYCISIRKISSNQKVNIVYDLFEKLLKMHQEGVVHQNIQENTILIQLKNDSVESSFCDFGLALDTSQLTKPHSLIYGEPSYTAPELLKRTSEDAQVTAEDYQAFDIFALGRVVYELSTVPPFHMISPISISNANLIRDCILIAGANPNSSYLREKQQKLAIYVKEYEDDVQQVRQALQAVFEEATLGYFSAKQLLAYIVWRCLEIDPKKRMTAQEGVEVLSCFRQKRAIEIIQGAVHTHHTIRYFTFEEGLKAMQQFFAKKDITTYTEMCHIIDWTPNDRTQRKPLQELAQIVYPSEEDAKIAFRAEQMYMAASSFDPLQRYSFLEIFKMCLVGAALLDHKDSQTFLVNKKVYRLSHSLLIDSTRRSVTILLQTPLFSLRKHLFAAVELLCKNNDSPVLCRNIVYKTPQKPEEFACIMPEIRYTKLYGNPLSVLCDFSKKDSPNILFTMERFDSNLSEFLTKEIFLSADHKILILYVLFEKISKMHQKDTFHSDIKLENILIRMENGAIDCKLADFGHAESKSGLSDLHYLNYGTPLYTAPELWKKIKTHQITINECKPFDMFALGCVAYVLSEGMCADFFSNTDISDAYFFRQKHMTKKGEIPIKYQKKMNAHLQKYDTKLAAFRMQLRKKFSEKVTTADELVAFIAWRLLETDPKKRMTAQECFELLSTFKSVEDLSKLLEKLVCV